MAIIDLNTRLTFPRTVRLTTLVPVNTSNLPYQPSTSTQGGQDGGERAGGRGCTYLSSSLELQPVSRTEGYETHLLAFVDSQTQAVVGRSMSTSMPTLTLMKG